MKAPNTLPLLKSLINGNLANVISCENLGDLSASTGVPGPLLRVQLMDLT
jgi:hypothetical protein